MRVPRTFLSLAILFLILIGSGTAQKKKPDPDEGYIPVVGPEDKKKKKGDEITQALPPPPELPAAVTADPTRLVYQVSPLSNKGLLSQQTRDALKALLKSNRGPIVKLRVFVAGSGDLRRISDIVGAAFQEKHQALPALSVAQVGALPMDGAQVVVEAAEVDRKETNPNGVAFLVGQTGATATEAIDKLKSVLTGAGMQSDDVLSATCFVSSLDEQRDTHQAMAATFPTAALDYVQMQRGDCEQCRRPIRLRHSSPGRKW
jgi:enamine deaminase RidA (YjgF/YER057c/UK114 family)